MQNFNIKYLIWNEIDENYDLIDSQLNKIQTVNFEINRFKKDLSSYRRKLIKAQKQPFFLILLLFFPVLSITIYVFLIIYGLIYMIPIFWIVNLLTQILVKKIILKQNLAKTIIKNQKNLSQYIKQYPLKGIIVYPNYNKLFSLRSIQENDLLCVQHEDNSFEFSIYEQIIKIIIQMIRRAQNLQTIKDQFYSQQTFDFFSQFVQEQIDSSNSNVSKISFLKNMFEQYKFIRIVTNHYTNHDNESQNLKHFFNEIKCLFDLNYSDDVLQVLEAIKNQESSKVTQLQKYKNMAKQLALEKQKYKSDIKNEKQEILQIVRDIKSKNVELQQQNQTLQFRINQIEQEQKNSQNVTKMDDNQIQQNKQKILQIQQQVVFRDRTIRELLKVIKYYEVLQPEGFKGFEQLNQIKTQQRFDLKKLKQKLMANVRSNSPIGRININQESENNLNSIISNEDEYKQLSDVILKKKFRHQGPLQDDEQIFDNSEKRKLMKMYILYFKNIYKQNENEIQNALKKLQQHDSQIGTSFENVLQDYKEFQQLQKSLENNKNEWDFEQQSPNQINFDFQMENQTDKQSSRYQDDVQYKNTKKIQQQKNILQLYSKDILSKDNIIQQQNFKIFQLQNQKNNQNLSEFKQDKEKIKKQETLNEQLKEKLKLSEQQIQQLENQIKSDHKNHQKEKLQLQQQIKESEKILKDLEDLIQQQQKKLDNNLNVKKNRIQTLETQIEELNKQLQQRIQQNEKQTKLTKQYEIEVKKKQEEIKKLKLENVQHQNQQKEMKKKLIFLYQDFNKKVQQYQETVQTQQEKVDQLKEFIKQGKLMKNFYSEQGSRFQKVIILCFKKVNEFQEQLKKIQKITSNLNELCETKLLKLSTLVKRNTTFYKDIELKYRNLCQVLDINQKQNFEKILNQIKERELLRKITEPFIQKYFLQKQDYDLIFEEIKNKSEDIQTEDNSNILQSDSFKFLISLENYFNKIKIYDIYQNQFQGTAFKQIWTQEQFCQKIVKILVQSSDLQNHFNPSNQETQNIYLIEQFDRDNYIKMVQGNEEISHIYQQAPDIDDYAQSLQDILQKRLKEQLQDYKVINTKSQIINDTATSNTINQKQTIEKLTLKIAQLEEIIKEKKLKYQPLLNQNQPVQQGKKVKDENQKKYIQEIQKKLNYYKDFLRVFDLNPKDPDLTENFFKKLQELRIDYNKLNLDVFDQKKFNKQKSDKEKKNIDLKKDMLEDFLNESNENFQNENIKEETEIQMQQQIIKNDESLTNLLSLKTQN